uniref:Uncharacterized protein n=1 Tax=Anguilla anguilla TaxID=7936 RepID=A0A0E9S2T6_ANGAN
MAYVVRICLVFLMIMLYRSQSTSQERYLAMSVLTV